MSYKHLNLASLIKIAENPVKFVSRLISNQSNAINLTNKIESNNDSSKQDDDYNFKHLGTSLKNLEHLNLQERKYIIEAEIELLREHGVIIPSYISDTDWKILLSEPHRLMKQLEIMVKREEKYKIKQHESSLHIHKPDSFEASDTIIFNSYDEILNDIKRNNAILSYRLHNPTLVLDFQFDDIAKHERISIILCNQIANLYNRNLENKEPFRLLYCNLKPQGLFHKGLRRRKLTSESCLAVTTERSYLDLFPKETLIYLSPHANSEMGRFSEDANYILGVLPEQREPLSYFTARKEGIRCERLPINIQNLPQWEGKKKPSFSLDVMLNVLHEIRKTKSWSEALKYLPQKK